MALHSFEQKTVFEFPSFRNAPPQVGERSKKQFPSFRVSAAPPDWREAFSKNVARTIQIPDSALRPGFWELSRFQEPAQAFQIPDSAPRPGFGELSRFQHPRYRRPEFRFRASPWDLEIANCKTKYKFQIPAQQFLFPLLHSAFTGLSGVLTSWKARRPFQREKGSFTTRSSDMLVRLTKRVARDPACDTRWPVLLACVCTLYTGSLPAPTGALPPSEKRSNSWSA